ncbi:LysR substrate-binding domain-containing protein [Polymorphospora rubra]|uniref:LysR substrate-binding domain-containing protein n=1 Tax=Polymorphospora rubra TaxID=338584 RepID=UPI0033C4DB1E
MSTDRPDRHFDRLRIKHLRVFDALTRRGRYRSTAAQFGATDQHIRDLVDDLEQAFGGGPGTLVTQVAGTRGAYVPTPAGEQARDIFGQILNLLDAAERLRGSATGQQRLLAFLPHHTQLVTKVMIALRDRDIVVPHTLDELDRAGGRFEERVLDNVRRRVYDLVIGPPPERRASDRRRKGLQTNLLYTARLEAMVPVERVGDGHLELHRLAEHELLLPPPGFRSRDILDSSFVESGLADRGLRLRVVKPSQVTGVLVKMGWDGLGTVVLPSDIALPYKAGSYSAGPDADRFAWVPLVTGANTHLTHGVYVTTRANRDAEPGVQEIVDAVAAAVDATPGLEGTDPLPAAPADRAARSLLADLAAGRYDDQLAAIRAAVDARAAAGTP